jgi:RHS repeat-associated protein
LFGYAQRLIGSLVYNVFNKPIRISGTGGITTIDYDANHDRFREISGSTVTYSFAGGLYEEAITGTTTIQKSYVDSVIVNTKVLNNGVAASNDTLYLHTDSLGSVEAYSDKLGAFVNRMSFSDWGKRQQSDWKTTSSTDGFPTANGYTGHHQLDQHKLVHMGGRVYDPALGRFLSADLFVQSPYSSQSFNRYSYVVNNPLSNIDPTGYECADYVSNQGTSDESHRFITDTCGAGLGGWTAADAFYDDQKHGGGTTHKDLAKQVDYGYKQNGDGVTTDSDGVINIKITAPREGLKKQQKKWKRGVHRFSRKA